MGEARERVSLRYESVELLSAEVTQLLDHLLLLSAEIRLRLHLLNPLVPEVVELGLSHVVRRILTVFN